MDFLRNHLGLSIRIALCLPPKIVFPVVRPEKGADRTIRVTGQKSPALPVEAGDDSILADRLEDFPACLPVPKLLSPPEVFLLGYFPELLPVLLKVIVEFLRGGEPDIRTGDGWRYLRSGMGGRQRRNL